MKPRCPIPNCPDTLTDRPVCAKHWLLVPQSIHQEIARTWNVVKQTRKGNAMSAALRKHRVAKERAVQAVIDQQNKKVSA